MLLRLVLFLCSLAALQAEEFEVRGTVRRLTPDKQRVVIAHEEIPGYMMAMTMEFTPARVADLAELAPGDVIAFRLSVSDRASRIDRIRKTGRSAVPAEAVPAPNAAPAREAPDVTLVDQSGKSFRLSELRGKAVALTFIFTRCPLPDYCPLMNRNFLAVQQALAQPVSDRWRLLSITMDPAHDTPEILARHAKGMEADPQRWLFAGGEVDEVRRLGAAFGLEFSGVGAGLSHNLRTVVIDPLGRVRKVFDGNRWKDSELVAEMRRALQ